MEGRKERGKGYKLREGRKERGRDKGGKEGREGGRERTKRYIYTTYYLCV